MTDSIIVNIAKQQLALFENDAITKTYSVSTGKAGIGQREDSFQTPLGKHEIADKIGDSCPINTVFVDREPTGEIYSDALAKANPHRDWILTRIIRLQGLEAGFNQGVDDTGHSVDTYSRCIYIHGTPDTAMAFG